MSKASSLIAILSVCAVLLLATVSQSMISSPRAKVTEGSSNSIQLAFGQPYQEYLTYENSAHGIEIQYPSDWDKYDGVEQGIIVEFYSPFENDADQYSENFGIFFDSTPSGMSLEEYVDAVLSSYSSFSDDFELLSNTPTTLAGRPAYEIVFRTKITDEYGELDLHSKHTLVLNDDRGYVFSYNSEESSYSQYLPIADDMLASLSLTLGPGPIIEEETDYESFESETHGIGIQYPTDWEKAEDPLQRDLVVKFVSPASSLFDYQEEFGIYVQRIPSVWTLDDYVEIVKDELEQSPLLNPVIVESSATTVDFKEAHKIVYTASVNETDAELKGMMLIALNRGTAFTFTFVTLSEDYSRFLPTIDKMIDSITFTPIQDRPIEPAQYLSYSNSTYSIKVVKYPDNWILSEPDDANVTEVTFLSSNYDASVSVGYFDYSLPQVPLNDFVDYRIEDHRKRITLFSLVSSDQTTIAGEPAWMIVYKGHLQLIGDKLFPYKVMEIYAISEGRAYVLTYGTFEELYSTYLPLVENIKDSLELDKSSAPEVVNGAYSDRNLGLALNLPEKWVGIQTEENGVAEVMVSAEDASLESDYSSMVIVSGTDEALDRYFEKFADNSITCNTDRTIELVELESGKAFRWETTCDSPELPKYYTYFMRTEDESILVSYLAPSDPVYRTNIEKFHESVASIELDFALDWSDIGEYAEYNGLEESEYSVSAAGEDYDVMVATNSSITDFEFDEEKKRLSIGIDGKDGTDGEFYVDIGTILEGDYVVTIDGEEVEETDDRVQVIDDQTTNHTFISIIYTHSTHDITITGTNVVPEFPVPAIFIGAAAILISVVVLRTSMGRKWLAGALPH